VRWLSFCWFARKPSCPLSHVNVVVILRNNSFRQILGHQSNRCTLTDLTGLGSILSLRSIRNSHALVFSCVTGKTSRIILRAQHYSEYAYCTRLSIYLTWKNLRCFLQECMHPTRNHVIKICFGFEKVGGKFQEFLRKYKWVKLKPISFKTSSEFSFSSQLLEDR
jgi:hypothetical protein